jgi:hypothetical protein
LGFGGEGSRIAAVPMVTGTSPECSCPSCPSAARADAEPMGLPDVEPLLGLVEVADVGVHDARASEAEAESAVITRKRLRWVRVRAPTKQSAVRIVPSVRW